MSEASPSEVEAKPRRSKLPLLLGLVLMLVLGGGGFYAVYSGLLLGGPGEDAPEAAAELEPLPDVAFVAIEPLVVSLGKDAGGRHLRFAAQIEVPRAHEQEVRSIVPRLVDVMNTYLRAVDISHMEESTALIRMRAQLLRRLQLVAGEGRVRDVLVTEFVIN